jgi:hypothetical protein
MYWKLAAPWKLLENRSYYKRVRPLVISGTPNGAPLLDSHTTLKTEDGLLTTEYGSGIPDPRTEIPISQQQPQLDAPAPVEPAQAV